MPTVMSLLKAAIRRPLLQSHSLFKGVYNSSHIPILKSIIASMTKITFSF